MSGIWRRLPGGAPARGQILDQCPGSHRDRRAVASHENDTLGRRGPAARIHAGDAGERRPPGPRSTEAAPRKSRAGDAVDCRMTSLGRPARTLVAVLTAFVGASVFASGASAGTERVSVA